MHPIQTHDLLIALDAAIERYEDDLHVSIYLDAQMAAQHNLTVLQRAKVILAELREYE